MILVQENTRDMESGICGSPG